MLHKKHEKIHANYIYIYILKVGFLDCSLLFLPVHMVCELMNS